MNGIYWDCDGTLMDTEKSYGLAWKEHLSDFGLEISEEETRQWVGIDDRLVHSFYAKNVDLENFEKTMASLGKIIRDVERKTNVSRCKNITRGDKPQGMDVSMCLSKPL